MEKIRKCPSCDIEIIYSSIYKKKRADEQNSVCRKCSNSSRKGDKHPMFGKQSPFKGKKHTDHSKDLISKNHADVSGEKNPMFNKGGMSGKNHSDDTKLKISKGNKNKNVTIETCEKISQSLLKYYKDNVSPTKGLKHNNEAKIKMRLSAIKRIEKDKFNGVQFYPSYNKKSISILEKYADDNNLNIQHAEKNGEFYIKELGYWLDAYDIDQNIVIEYNEKYHKYIKEKDNNRRELIIQHLNCQFIVINEDGSVEKYN